MSDVTRDRDGLPARRHDLVRHVYRAGAVYVENPDLRSLGGQPQGDGAADAVGPSPTGDQCNPPLQTFRDKLGNHHCLLPWNLRTRSTIQVFSSS
jgi:hypothetical protein